MFLKITFIIFSAIISFFDLKTGSVPRPAFVIAFPLILLLKTINFGYAHFYESAIGLLTGFIIFILAYFLSKKKLGLADVWYSAIIGMVHGFWLWYAAVGLACITGLIFILIMGKRKIPFIPFMALGSIIILIIF